MKSRIILLKDVPNLGMAGDVTEVSQGYARNYLFPRKFAAPATKGNLKALEADRAKYEKEKQRKKGVAEELAKKVNGFECVMNARVGKNKKLFGSITAADILRELSRGGLHLERHSLKLPETIKTTGEFKVDVRLHPEVKAQVHLRVVPEVTEETEKEEEDEEKEKGKEAEVEEEEQA